MAFTLTNGSAVKVVATEQQAKFFTDRGWVVKRGKATKNANPWKNYTVGEQPVYVGMWANAVKGSFEHFVSLDSPNITSSFQVKKAFSLCATINGVLKENSLDLIGVKFVEQDPYEKEEGVVYILSDGSAVLYNGLKDITL